MKKQKSLSQSALIVAAFTLLLLSFPLVAMQFTDEVDWSPFDFLVMGLILFTTGFAYVLVSRSSPNFAYRAAVALGIGTTFLLVWSNLAVGLIGGGPHAGNLLYIGVLAVVIVGTALSHFTAKGMERTMFAAALSLAAIAGIALLAGMQHYPHSSVGEIVGVNAFFATLYSVAGLLFRFLSQKQLITGAAAE